MNPITSNKHGTIVSESAITHLYEHLMEMDLDVMCDEVGISQADILDRFKDKVYNYFQHIDRGVEDAIYADQDDADEEPHTEEDLLASGFIDEDERDFSRYEDDL